MAIVFIVIGAILMQRVLKRAAVTLSTQGGWIFMAAAKNLDDPLLI
jgi:hypothetical protein